MQAGKGGKKLLTLAAYAVGLTWSVGLVAKLGVGAAKTVKIRQQVTNQFFLLASTMTQEIPVVELATA